MRCCGVCRAAENSLADSLREQTSSWSFSESGYAKLKEERYQLTAEAVRCVRLWLKLTLLCVQE
eukprot:5612574-Amphidinium_carterae.2